MNAATAPTQEQEHELLRIIHELRSGNRQTLSKVITLLESRRTDHQLRAHAILDRCMGMATPAESIRIGITGSPGAGKSTFIEIFGETIIKQGHQLAILAIDPSSERSKGSILGDQARMTRLAGKKEVFIRPTASSGHLGGTSAKTAETIVLCEAAGHDVIIVETVGVGQSEIQIDTMVDIVILLMLPGSGDELQGIKRGIMEIADIVAISKSDGEQAAAAATTTGAFQTALAMLPARPNGRKTNVIPISSITGTGITKIWQMVSESATEMKQSGALEQRRALQRRKLLDIHLQTELMRAYLNHHHTTQLHNDIEQQVSSGILSPHSGALRLIEAFLHQDQHRL